MSIKSTRFIGEGWNARAFVVNEELIFRFPKHAGHWEELKREIAFLAFAADQLPLPTPRYVHQAPHSPAACHGYAAYRYVPGQKLELDGLSGKERAAAAECIAGFLRSLHELQPNPAIAGLLPRDDEEQVAREYLTEAEREIVPKLPRPQARALLEMFETYLAAPGNFVFTPVVLHADLSRDHVLMASNAESGIIDFGDVNWGDPDYDFMYLFVDFGLAFSLDVARRYGHADLGRLQDKLRYYGIVDQIGTIREDQGRSLPGHKMEAWQHLRQLLAGKKKSGARGRITM